MKKFQKIILALLAGFLLAVAVLVGLFYFGVLKSSMFGTFRVQKESQRELVVAAPLEQVMLNLMAADVQTQIMRELGAEVLESQSLEKKLNMGPMQLISGQWSVDMMDELTVRMADSGMGPMQIPMHAQIHARPGLVESKTLLAEPTEQLNAFRQIITMKPVPGNPRETKITILYETDVNVPYPGLDFVRKYAENQVAEAHEKTLGTICGILERNAASPQLLQTPQAVQSPEPEVKTPEPEVEIGGEIEIPEGFKGFEDDEGFEGFEDAADEENI